MIRPRVFLGSLKVFDDSALLIKKSEIDYQISITSSELRDMIMEKTIIDLEISNRNIKEDKNKDTILGYKL
jgi:hypothetical protein